jgi:tetratricopeptide (TPR) repeat protein
MTFFASVDRRYGTAWTQYRSNVIEQAIGILRERPAPNQDDPRLLWLRGLLAFKAGHEDFGEACLRRAVTALSSEVGCLIDLGDMLQRRGRYGESLSAYRQASGLAPDDPLVHSRIGHCLARLGLLDEALHACQQALRLDPNRGHTYCEIGQIQAARGSLKEAVASYEHAVTLDPDNPEPYALLGMVHLHLKNWDAAIASFCDGLDRNPVQSDLQRGLGQALLWAGRFAEAADAFRAVLISNSHDIDVCRYMVSTLELLGRSDEIAGAQYRLGHALECCGRLSEAASAYQQVLLRKPDSLNALVHLGSMHLRLGQPSAAIPCFEAALGIEPDQPAAHQRLGHAHALTGNLEKNWDETAWIDRYGPWKRFEQPLWDGSSLEGKTILLWLNAQLGDTVQFLRFVPFVKERGARVLVESRRELVPLVEKMPCVDRVVPMGTPIPRFDVHAFLTTIPRILRTGWGNIPAGVPYLTVSADLVTQWRVRLGNSHGRTIGLVWASARDRYRQIPLSAFGRFAELSGIRFVSLQFGPPAVELLFPPAGLHLESPLDESCSIADTAAVIQNLDLVISMDTLVAHVAGALGQQTWMLLPFARDWRWGLEGERTPWYPTMRLFRQRRIGEWGDVLDQVRAALGVLLTET